VVVLRTVSVPGWRRFLVGLRLECIGMDEWSLLLEGPMLKVLLLEDGRGDWVNPVFDEGEGCGGFHALFPVLLEQASGFFECFGVGSETFWCILRNIGPYMEERGGFGKCKSPEERLAVTLGWV
jgi:hypothetical protein